MQIGDRIRELRENRNMSQEKLAKELKVTTGTIGMYEINKRQPSLEMVEKLSIFFDVPTDYLLGLDDDNSPEIRCISRKAKNMTGEQKKKLYDVAKTLFPEAFKES